MHRDEPIVPLGDVTRAGRSTLVPIEVRTYSGHRADERPMSLFLDGVRLEVIEILFAWIEENPEGTRRRFCYEIVTGPDHARRVILFQHPEGRWFLRREEQ